MVSIKKICREGQIKWIPAFSKSAIKDAQCIFFEGDSKIPLREAWGSNQDLVFFIKSLDFSRNLSSRGKFDVFSRFLQKLKLRNPKIRVIIVGFDSESQDGFLDPFYSDSVHLKDSRDEWVEISFSGNIIEQELPATMEELLEIF